MQKPMTLLHENRTQRLNLFYRIALLLFADAVLSNLVQLFSLFLRLELNVQALRSSPHLHDLLTFAPIQTVLTLLVFALMGLYSSLWAYAGLEEAGRIFTASVLVSVLQLFLMRSMNLNISGSFFIINTVFLAIVTSLERFSYRIMRDFRHTHNGRKQVRTLLVGGGCAASIALQDLNNSAFSRNKIVCIVDDDTAKQGRRLRGVPVVGQREDIPAIVRHYQIKEIILAIPSATAAQKREITSICQSTGCETKVLPSIALIASGRLDVRQIRSVQIEDLLGRACISVNLDEIACYVKGKVVMVTGGGGSIGSELCRQLAAHSPSKLIILDICENVAYDIQQELRRLHPDLPLIVLIGSIRDKARMADIFETYRPQIVYHAAAHKHVPLMEDSPKEAVKNNVFGTKNLCEVADQYKVETFVQISTDKAVNPTNVMGATKRICELLVQYYSRCSKTNFVCVRFGNVLGSSGSVIPLFRRQIEQGGPVTVTHKDIIRFFMTIPEAVSLVLQAGAYAKNGEIYVLDMGEPVRIDDLARNMIRLSGYEPDVDIEIQYVGLRPGEKLFEELLMDEEGMRSTANHLIYIGKPLEINEAVFDQQLAVLDQACYDENTDIRPLLQEIVPSYQPKVNQTTANA